MKTKYILMMLLLSSFSLGVFAAGSPLNESFTNLISLSNNAVAVGKQGDKEAFLEKTNNIMEALKLQDEKGSSIRLQRASTKIKMALKAAKAGDLQEGIDNIQQGIVIMEIDKKS